MKEWLKERWKAVLACALFTVVSTAIVIANASWYGLSGEMTISKYVGLAVWSAVLFWMSNAVIAWVWASYALKVARDWGLSRMWYVLVVVGAVALMVLSFCPAGMFDTVPEEIGLVTKIHKFAAYTMFVLMVVTDLGLLLRVKPRWFKAYAGVYLTYGLVLAFLAVIGNGWFYANSLWCESAFLFFYLLMLCLIPKRVGRKEPDVV